MSLTIGGPVDQQIAHCHDVHEYLVQLARDALADGTPALEVLTNTYRAALGADPDQIATVYACCVMRDAERAP
jgi:ABC-type microcin C transport system permease subunit YejB